MNNYPVAVEARPLPHNYNHASDSEYHRLRGLAEQAYERRNKLSEESQLAYKNGEKSKAHELSERGKEEIAKAKKYNFSAAEYVFRQNNADSASNEIDLHGLFVDEAQWFLEKRIYAMVQEGNSENIRVVVGKGLHSTHGVAKLKPAIESFCYKANLKNYIDPHNSGVLIIELRDSSIPQSLDASYSRPSLSKQQQVIHEGYQPPSQGLQGPPYYMAPPAQQQQQPQQSGDDGNFLTQILSLLCLCIPKNL